MSHTPAPWGVYKGDQVWEAKNPQQSAARICVIENGAKDIYPQLIKAEREANARLISAAPELLEALKVYVCIEETAMHEICKKAIHWKGMNSKNRQRWHRLEDARKALAKAEGK